MTLKEVPSKEQLKTLLDNQKKLAATYECLASIQDPHLNTIDHIIETKITHKKLMKAGRAFNDALDAYLEHLPEYKNA